MAWGREKRMARKPRRHLMDIVKHVAKKHIDAAAAEIAQEVGADAMGLFMCNLDSRHICKMANRSMEIVESPKMLKRFWAWFKHWIKRHQIDHYPFGSYCRECEILWVKTPRRQRSIGDRKRKKRGRKKDD